MAGRLVTTKKLRKVLADFWGSTHEIPSVQTIRKLLRDSGLQYGCDKDLGGSLFLILPRALPLPMPYYCSR